VPRNAQWLSIAFLCLVMSACGGGGGGSNGGGSGGGGSQPPSLRSISVAPSNATILLANAGSPSTTQAFTATGTYSDSSTKDLSSQVTWTSSATNVATISPTGTATAVGLGTTTIKAASGSVSGSTTLTVSHQVVSIAVASTLTSLAPGTAQQFTARATYNDNTTADATSFATWSSSNTAAATVSNTAGSNGIVTAVASGSATVTATIGSVSGTLGVTVSNAKLASLAVTPASKTFGIGTSGQFTATGSFDDGTTQDISNVATWSSSASNIVVSTSKGFFTAKGLGTANITAKWQNITSPIATAIVDTSSVQSFNVNPASAQIAQSTQQRFHGLATLKDGSSLDVTSVTGITWSSSDTSVATVSNSGTSSSGTATGVVGSANPVTIKAQLGASISAQALLTVTSATIQSIAVAPATLTLQVGATKIYIAVGKFSDQTTQDITAVSAWTSTDANVASLQTGSTFTANGSGTATITASFQGKSGTASLTCNTGPAAIKIKAASVTINALSPNNTAQLLAVDATTGSVLDRGITWSTSDSSVATVSSTGLVTGLSVGTANITGTVTANSVSAFSIVTVKASPLVSLTVNPSSAKIANTTGVQFDAAGKFADGTTQSQLARYVHWTSSSGTVATVSNSGNSGFALSSSAGTTQISAQLNAVTSSPATLTVTSATLNGIAITPANATINSGTSQTFKATGSFSDGTSQDISSLVAWSSSNTGVFVFGSGAGGSSSGAGSTTITASFDGVSGTTQLTVH
jgi:trimeric autotransporter adhesin